MPSPAHFVLTVADPSLPAAPGLMGVLHCGSDALTMTWAAVVAPLSVDSSPSSVETLLTGPTTTSAPYTAVSIGDANGPGDRPSIVGDVPSSIAGEAEVGVDSPKPNPFAPGHIFARVADAATHLHKGLRPLPCAKTSPVVLQFLNQNAAPLRRNRLKRCRRRNSAQADFLGDAAPLRPSLAQATHAQVRAKTEVVETLFASNKIILRRLVKVRETLASMMHSIVNCEKLHHFELSMLGNESAGVEVWECERRHAEEGMEMRSMPTGNGEYANGLKPSNKEKTNGPNNDNLNQFSKANLKDQEDLGASDRRDEQQQTVDVSSILEQLGILRAQKDTLWAH
ncbi:hypothetical protein SUGI_0260960 [Cryptomeria japonica]|nr:hypothetical protein SUGI_0260960 [Cryptomeria japonica]